MTTESTLPPGATIVPNAGRPADAPGPAADKAATKRDSAAAGELPQLFKDLTAARALVESLGGGRLDVHTIEMNIGGMPSTYHPADREKMAAAITADMNAKVDSLESRIKALGFEPG